MGISSFARAAAGASAAASSASASAAARGPGSRAGARRPGAGRRAAGRAGGSGDRMRTSAGSDPFAAQLLDAAADLGRVPGPWVADQALLVLGERLRGVAELQVG